ncbi:MAG: F0F1 ATP synthase subunit delta [Candidatus Planktophila sp.]|nr:F0F1 ATP synthase subunit delta [Candidatus Planktophila sp.]
MRAQLGGSSRQSLVAARTALDAAVKGVDAQAASTLSAELFFAADVLGSNISVRRALTDTSRDAAAKGTLIKDLLASKVGAATVSLLTELSALRWSGAKDLVQVIEQLAIEAEATAANISGDLDRVENEMFVVSTTISNSSELRKAFKSDAGVAKSQLVAELLKNASSSTTKLVSQLVNSWRGRSIESAFADYQWALAARRNRVIALVRIAAPISQAQQDRLAAALDKQVGQPVRMNIEIDPAVLGGVSVKFADEMVDGSVSNRLAGAARALAGSK